MSESGCCEVWEGEEVLVIVEEKGKRRRDGTVRRGKG